MTPRVEVVDFGPAALAAGLIAEYDAEDDAIRVNACAVARVRALEGDDEARRFVACAVAHERHHRAHPLSAEDAAHGAARDACGIDPRRYESVLRGLRS